MTTGRPGPKPSESAAPQVASVAELAATSAAWKVQSGDFGRWLIAERVIHSAEHQWRIGLTPVGEKLVAAMLWRDDEVVAHRRGSEGDMCAQAQRWVVGVLGRED